MGRIREKNEEELEGDIEQKSREMRENKEERERKSKEENMNSLYYFSKHLSTCYGPFIGCSTDRIL